MREPLNVKQKQVISETPAKDGGGLVETCFSSLGRMVAFQIKRPWLGCCHQGSVLIECDPCRLDHQSCKTGMGRPIRTGTLLVTANVMP